MTCQPAIMRAIPSSGRFLTLGLAPGADCAEVLSRLRAVSIDDGIVAGLGQPLVQAAGGSIPALRAFPALSGPGVSVPSSQGALWFFIGGDDPGASLHRGRALLAALGGALRLDEDVLAFKFGGGRDLSGFEDGTENPKGDRAAEVALVSGGPLDGSSFVAAQRWVHDLDRLQSMAQAGREELIGRRQESNEEMADAPPSAHVKRAAQESFDPQAFMLRRSMPYGSVGENGLYFVAYGASLDPFEHVLRRMAGLEDGIVDGLLEFSRPVSGGYYWCPPVREGRLDLRALGSS